MQPRSELEEQLRQRDQALSLGTLEAEFAPGKNGVSPIYRYHNVPRSVYAELMNHEKHGFGQAFHRLIKLGGYRYERMR